MIAAAEEARRKYRDVERELGDIEKDITKLKDVMEKDYGKHYIKLCSRRFSAFTKRFA